MRAAFKYWKRRKPPPDFEIALNLHKYSTDSHFHNVDKILLIGVSDELDYDQYGLEHPNKWDVYTIENNKGLIYIKNPFTSAGQRYWTIRCLKDFSKKPYKLNIDPHGYLNENEDWWTASHDNNSERAHSLLKSLRWSTLGYHHDWDSKLYTENNRNDFPVDLEELCKAITSALGFTDYVPQASIVNYYHMDSTLAPHTDHSEKNLDAPLVSISFGQSAIFLIGSESANDDPTPMYLHSGDIIVMSKESRLCYHAVPKIIHSEESPYEMKNQDVESSVKTKKYFMYDVQDDELWTPFSNYLSHSRININVRQVLHCNQKTLDDR